ncbi:FAD-dependent monooxygenase [Oxyplasma meridianum]|uniref:FAD-dependent monooxygenase n=1 Tax=Oxyplasma meridianum TaxID=3073602 RepID=A0AAX4NFW4_9ARCH
MYKDDFDKYASAMAINYGTDVEINARVMDVSVNNEYAEVKYKQDGTIKYKKSKIVVGADGTNSRVRKSLNYEMPKKLFQRIRLIPLILLKIRMMSMFYRFTEQRRLLRISCSIR